MSRPVESVPQVLGRPFNCSHARLVESADWEFRLNIKPHTSQCSALDIAPEALPQRTSDTESAMRAVHEHMAHPRSAKSIVHEVCSQHAYARSKKEYDHTSLLSVKDFEWGPLARELLKTCGLVVNFYLFKIYIYK